MSIKLEKGQSISLKKQVPKLEKIMCGLGWDTSNSRGVFGFFFGSDFDLDASVLCLNQSGRLMDTNNVVYFSNLSHFSGSITHLGDNLTGEGEGDDEQIIVDLTKIPPYINKLIFVVNIYQPLIRNQDFSKINNAFVRLVNLKNKQEIARYTLSGNGYEGKTAMIMAEITQENNDWNLTAVGKGLKVGSLDELIKRYL
jgi:stress response protein SCP2